MTARPSIPRRRQILEALAGELEHNPGGRITTARLAEVVGVSEAALYRHFPSKARMFESLIEFAEESVFSAITRILREHSEAAERCRQVLGVLLTFSERNPGITRVLLGDALVGENPALHVRVTQYFDRVETQLRQVLREGVSRSGVQRVPTTQDSSAFHTAAGLMMAVVEGRMRQFLRSGFQRKPLEGWDRQWHLLAQALFG